MTKSHQVAGVAIFALNPETPAIGAFWVTRPQRPAVAANSVIGMASPSSAASADYPSRVSLHNVLTLNLLAGTRKSGNSGKHQHSANHQTQ